MTESEAKPFFTLPGRTQPPDPNVFENENGHAVVSLNYANAKVAPVLEEVIKLRVHKLNSDGVFDRCEKLHQENERLKDGLKRSVDCCEKYENRIAELEKENDRLKVRIFIHSRTPESQSSLGLLQTENLNLKEENERLKAEIKGMKRAIDEYTARS